MSVFRTPSNNCNGNTRDAQGRLITCERRQLTRTEPDGTITVLMDRFQGKRLNSPNDVVVHPDGHIWFTDPGYGIMSWYEGEQEPFELPTRVYRLDPTTGQATVANEEIGKPNGICFSPDFKRLHVVDTATIRASLTIFTCLMSWTAPVSSIAGCFTTWEPEEATGSAAIVKETSG